MRISFMYDGIARTGQVLGLKDGVVSTLVIVREDSPTGNVIKTFTADRMTNTQTVLEPHEQMPGVFNLTQPFTVPTSANFLDRLAAIEKFLSDGPTDREAINSLARRLEALTKRIDNI